MPYIQNISNFLETIYPHGVNLITLHWTVGDYNQIFQDDYHFQITGDGQIWLDERAFDQHGNFVPLAHAWHHNSQNIGIALCAMNGAKEPLQWTPKDLYTFPESYGEYPPSTEQINILCTLVSSLVRKFQLGFDQVKTHYELALEDGYPGERWEFKYERPLIMQRVQQIYEVTKPV